MDEQKGQETESEEETHYEEVDKELKKRKQKLPVKFNDYEMYMAFDAISYIEKVPESIEELNERNYRNLWTEAMER
ncbi:hypothetical protein QE152_g30249 [Popillia japonica]|uniref:Uncharacterized protein n=1 Tax=Popillia japonica TaxID=7064 RepID=A0AAW1JFL4_POPJA